MRNYSFRLFLSVPVLAFALNGQARAAEFQALKKGEWKVEVVESSLGAMGKSVLKPQTICIDEKSASMNWEKRMKEELAKTKMDCDLKQLKQEAAAISYSVSCKGTEASAAKNMPVGSKVDGIMNVSRESDTSYYLEQDSKASGLAMDQATLEKIPAAQRAAVAGILATQTAGIQIKSKQHYTFVSANCAKEAAPVKDKEAAKDSVKAAPKDAAKDKK